MTKELIIAILLFIVGLVLLIKGGDWFVDGASGIAKRLHIPEILIGATVVSIGTTLPEVMVSATSAAVGAGALAYGNAIGSVICNTALIAALTVTIKPAAAERKSLIIPVIFFFASAVFYAVCAYVFGYFYRWAGILLLLVFVGYIVLSSIQAKRESKLLSAEELGETESENDGEKKPEGRKKGLIKDIVFLVIGAALIAGGAKLLVDNGTKIAEIIGIPQSVIALTFVALGTSLPELVTAITSLVKGHGALSLGNLIGANLFNIVLVSGVSITIAPFAVPAEALFFGLNRSLVIDIPVMFAVMLVLTVPALIRGKLSRWQGIVLLAIYAAFCVVQFAF